MLKSCKGETCSRPWEALHPQGNVLTLQDALSAKFDSFYTQQTRVRYDHCELGYIPEAEGPQFEKDGLIYRQEPSGMNGFSDFDVNLWRWEHRLCT